MEVMEIVLLIVGAVVFILSFVLPVRKEEMAEETQVVAKEEIKTMISREMDSVRAHVDDVVEEAVGYAVEKTERSLERLTNEKIMAVNEYSDTVLQEIHKNHEEVMFLYDMLNDKHTNLKNTVSEVNKTVKEAEATVTNFQKLSVETIKEEKVQTETVVIPAKEKESQNPEKKQKRVTKVAKETKTGQDTVLLPESESIGANKNEQILELYRQGKSNVVIAKTLGLGVGEVKLVIDLYKNS
ncbi:MAG: hypothetical protein E7287_05705 [Lachnospiraceae bacterium]|nr:hypothetical protein [Lachnospiraceae bacterium]